tara:strand:- start:46 stop:303 length:258 start_codon:yes stop_codon:yes gene_type:complete
MKNKYINYLDNDVNYVPSGKSLKAPKKKRGKMKPNYEQMLKMRLQTLNAVKGNLQDLVSGKITISEFTNGIEDSIKATKNQIKRG